MKLVEIKVNIEDRDNVEKHLNFIQLKLKDKRIKKNRIKLKRRSIDARSKRVFYILVYEILAVNESFPKDININYIESSGEKKVLIVGAGPAGYFAALSLLESGIKPVILERGKDVRARRKDLRNIQQLGIVNPDSNYCFGEGGAGTYSDGKLYTRSSKRGDIKKILQILVDHGASKDILVDAHPHIGSNKLPVIVQTMRQTILNFGGEVHFEHRVEDFIIKNKKVIGVRVNNGHEFIADAVILATGHSARDIYELLRKRNIKTEFKEFALGVRVEHPQSLIDEIQYGQKNRSEYLPAAKYGLVCQVKERGVFSFCMCPGGFIVPASTDAGELVINGMSLSRRDSPFANSGVVVSIKWEDLANFHEFNEFAGLEFQKKVEKDVFNSVPGSSQKAPGQKLTDFMAGRESTELLKTSYIPGIESKNLNGVLPGFISQRLKLAFKEFNKKMYGYLSDQAQILATESRTSSPVRIPRDIHSLMHPEYKNLYPCGEGAGYAGGIVSAAMDGQRVANAIKDILK